MEIILLRHGEPELEFKGYIYAQKFKILVKKYIQTGIKDSPPKKLKNVFSSYYVVCSELKRSQQSAEKLEFIKINFSSNLFDETGIPHYDNSFIKLPVGFWLIYYRLIWLLGFNKNGESFSLAKKRATKAAEKLIILAHENDKIIVVGHGLMNRLIAKELRRKDWKGPSSPSKKYWQYGQYNKSI